MEQRGLRLIDNPVDRLARTIESLLVIAPTALSVEELAAAALTLARSLMVNLSTAQTAVVQSLVVSREALKGGVHAALEIEIGKVFDP